MNIKYTILLAFFASILFQTVCFADAESSKYHLPQIMAGLKGENRDAIFSVVEQLKEEGYTVHSNRYKDFIGANGPIRRDTQGRRSRNVMVIRLGRNQKVKNISSTVLVGKATDDCDKQTSKYIKKLIKLTGFRPKKYKNGRIDKLAWDDDGSYDAIGYAAINYGRSECSVSFTANNIDAATLPSTDITLTDAPASVTTYNVDKKYAGLKADVLQLCADAGKTLDALVVRGFLERDKRDDIASTQPVMGYFSGEFKRADHYQYKIASLGWDGSKVNRFTLEIYGEDAYDKYFEKEKQRHEKIEREPGHKFKCRDDGKTYECRHQIKKTDTLFQLITELHDTDYITIKANSNCQ